MEPQDYPVKRRPLFALWMFERGLKAADVKDELGVTEVTINRYMRPFGDDDRRIPSRKVMPKITRLTEGQITAAHFHDLGPDRPRQPEGVVAP